MSLTGVSYPGKGISYTPDPAFPTNNPLKFRVAQVIQVSMISMIKPNGSNSILVIHGVNGEISTTAEALWAAGTAASYAAQSGQHVLLTDATTSKTFYLNADLFKGVSNVPGGVNSLLQYGTEGAQFKSVTVVGTAATIQAAFDAATNNATANTVDVLAAGVNQGTATAVTGTSPLYIKITGGTGGILLPAATLGSFINIDSQVGVDLNAYPAVGGYIGGGAVNVPFVLQANGNASFVCNTAGYWEQAENTFPTVNADTVTSIGSTLSLAATTSVNVVAGGTTVTETLNSGGTGIFKVNAFMVVASGTSIPAAAPGPVVRNMYIDITAVAVAGHGIQLKSPAACTQYFISVGAVANALTIYDDAGVAVSIPVPANTLASLYYINGAWKATHSALV